MLHDGMKTLVDVVGSVNLSERLKGGGHSLSTGGDGESIEAGLRVVVSLMGDGGSDV